MDSSNIGDPDGNVLDESHCVNIRQGRAELRSDEAKSQSGLFELNWQFAKSLVITHFSWPLFVSPCLVYQTSIPPEKALDGLLLCF